MANNPKIVIIGGGLAGLTAALHLAERGLKPLLLEADPQFCGGRVGGKPAARLTGPDGKEWVFPAEHGIHGFWQQYHNLRGMLKRHGILPKMVKADRQQWVHGTQGRVRRAEMGRVVRRTFWPAPFHYGALFFRPSFLGMLDFRDYLAIPQVLSSLLVAVSVDPMVEGKMLEGSTLADFCKGWSPAMRAFVATLARSGLSAHPENVPLSGFVAFLRFYTVLRRDSQAFEYLPDDAGSTLIEPLVHRIKELGGEIVMGRAATRLERSEDGKGWKVFWQSGDERGTLEADYTVLAADASNTAQILQNSAPTQEIAGQLKWPTGLETAVFRFWFAGQPEKRAEAGIVSGDFIIDNFFWLHRFQNLFRRWQEISGGSVIESHIYGPSEVLAQSDEALLDRAQDDLERIYPMLRGKVLHRTIQRNPGSHTLFSLGSLSEHLGVRTPWPGLFCCGDWVRHPNGALFLERATVTGIEAVNAVLVAEKLPEFALVPHQKPEPLARLTQIILRGAASSIRGVTAPGKKNLKTNG
jgi:isorenieratene synthase